MAVRRWLLPFTALLLAGCGLAPSDPAPFVSGARFENGVVRVKVPLCPNEALVDVSATDADDTGASPRVLWSASSPRSAAVSRGWFTLWSGEGFRHSSAAPSAATIPASVDLLYVTTSGDGGGDVLDLAAVRRSRLGPARYWTWRGPETARTIDAQLGCATSPAD